ncbi:MAG: hypothetical protein IJV75_03280 [Alphaproteobacteria bacterium]|nr:hypothetical protein [Alphaproteobacteria bacterium]
MKVNNIVKVFGVFACSIAFSASAQMLDLLGSGAVGGAMTKESVSSVNQGMNALKYTQIVQALSQNAAIIKIKYMGNYTRVGTSDISGNPFRPYHYNIGHIGNNRFYIELTGVEQELCKRLFSSGVGAKEININGQGQNKNACSHTSQIKFVFD